ncbi:hypothetical protein ACWDYJ_32610 [Streptomyces sp. NPDC003042]
MRGFAVPDHPGVRLRTLADVFAYAEVAGTRLRIDGAETQVRRPKAGRPGRRAFVSGKKEQNTIKTTTISAARAVCCGRVRTDLAVYTTRPRCAPRVSPSSADSTRR